MKEYVKVIREDVEVLVTKALAKEDLSDEQILHYEGVQARIEAVLTGGVMTGYPFVPEIGGGAPFLSPSFVKSLYHLVLEISPAISMIASWMVPGISDFKNQRGVSRSSEACLMLQHLNYFHGFGNPGWVDSRPDATHYWSVSAPAACLPSQVIGELWATMSIPYFHLSHAPADRAPQLVGFILTQRTLVFLPNLHQIDAAHSRMHAKQLPKEYQMSDDAMVLTQAALKRWFEAALAEAQKKEPGIKRAKVRIRDLQTCPPAIYENDEAQPSRQSPQFLRGLERSLITHFNCPINSNGNAVRKRVAGAIWAQCISMEKDTLPLIERIPHLSELRTHLENTIRATDGLETYTLWYAATTHSDKQPAAVPESGERDVVRVAETDDPSALQQALQDVFQTLLQGLSRRGLCDVPIIEDGDDAGIEIHPVLKNLLRTLFHTAKAIQEDGFNVHRGITNLAAYQVLSWEEPATDFNFEDYGFRVRFASTSEVQAYYPVKVLGSKRAREDENEDDVDAHPANPAKRSKVTDAGDERHMVVDEDAVKDLDGEEDEFRNQ
ncbi:hypothetical protein DFH09DRAFT_1157851 [Mycena vulgaris]|nr:hypothetical protein DFH09DRAFT_1157851 [Mycena vulgaris]